MNYRRWPILLPKTLVIWPFYSLYFIESRCSGLSTLIFFDNCLMLQVLLMICNIIILFLAYKTHYLWTIFLWNDIGVPTLIQRCLISFLIDFYYLLYLSLDDCTINLLFLSPEYNKFNKWTSPSLLQMLSWRPSLKKVNLPVFRSADKEFRFGIDSWGCHHYIH